MLPLNILLLSMALAVFSRVSAAAPLEVEKEKDEVEIEGEEAEGELSEEEEDEDQSKDQTQGLLIGQHSTAAPSKGTGPVGSSAAEGVIGPSPGSSGSVTAPEGGSAAAAGGSAGSAGGLASASSGSAGPGSADPASAGPGSVAGPVSVGSPGSAGGPGGSLSGPEGGSVGSLSDPSHDPASPPEAPGPAPDPSGFDGADSDSNGNGHKLMNGAPADNRPITDPGPGPDPASHDFLLSLMGGSDPFGLDVTDKPPVYQTVGSPVGTLVPNSGLALDSGTAHASLPALDSAVSSVVLPAPPDGPDSPDSPDYNGNGRLTVISQSVTQRVPEVRTHDILVSHDLNGNMDAVTSFPFELTASGLGLGPDSTEPSHVLLHTESVDHITHLVSTGVFSQTELVTTVTDTATDSGAAAVTDVPLTNTQPGPDPGPATESYYSQGPEGSENVELEDSC